MLLNINLNKSYKPQELYVTFQNGHVLLIQDTNVYDNPNLISDATNADSDVKQERQAALVSYKQNKRYISVADLTTLLKSEQISNLFANRTVFPAVYDNKKQQLHIIRFVELQVKTSKSTLDSVIRVNQLVDKDELAVAVNEHGNMYSMLDLDKMAHAQNKKPIFGVELYMDSLPQTYIVQRGDSLNLVSQLKHESIADLKQDNPSVANLKDKDTLHERTLTLTHAHEKNTLPLLAKNPAGYHTVSYLTSAAQTQTNVGEKPQLSWNVLEKRHDNVICLSGSEDSEFYRALLHNDVEHATQVAKKLQEMFHDDFYIEVFHKGAKFDTAVQLAKQIATKLGIKTVAVNDAHMLDANQADELHALQTIATDSTIDQNFNVLPGKNYYIHTSEEAEQEFADDTLSMDNTIEIYHKIEDYEILPHRYFQPAFLLPKKYHTQNEYFEFLVHKGFDVRMKQLNIVQGTDKYKKYQERLTFEMGVIEKMKYSGYFIVVADYVNYARRNYQAYDDETVARWKHFMVTHGYNPKVPIAVGYGRGSAAGSLVCYSMFITDVDPMPYDLLFERFLNPDRVSMPDIDMDFSKTGRPESLAYVSNFYNHGDNVDWLDSRFAGIIVFGTLQGKQALRDTTRIYGEKVQVGNKLSQLYDNADADNIKDALNDADFMTYVNSDQKIKQIVDMASKLEGLEKSIGQHACGKVIAPDAVTKFLPISHIKEPNGGTGIVTQITNVEAFGLLKMDFLGLKNLNVLEDALKSINKEIHDNNKKNGTHVPYVNQNTIVEQAINDLDTYKFLRDQHTFGIFQFSSSGMTDLVGKMFSDIDRFKQNPQTCFEMFNRLTAATALYRPGPMQFIDQYLANMKKDDSQIQYPVPQLHDILYDTYGIIVYQEQVMLASRKVAGFSRGASDELRRAVGHKIPELMAKYKTYFLNGSNGQKINGHVIPGAVNYSHITQQQANDLWAAIEKFASYGFNKSHAVSYTYISVVEAYLSLHYPEEYFAAQLNVLSGDSDKVSDALTHIKARRLLVLQPDVNESANNFAVTMSKGRKGIRFGLNGIKRSGRKADKIIAERDKNGKFTSLINCGVRLQKQGIWNKTVYEALTYSGAFDSFAGTRQEKIAQEPVMLDFIKTITKQKSIFALASQQNFTQHLLAIQNSEQVTAQDDTDMLFKEKEYNGFFITGHPLTKYEKLVGNNALFTTVNYVNRMKNNQHFNVLAVIDSIKVITTKSLSKMAIINVDDPTASLRATVFSSTYQTDGQYLEKNAMVILEGYIKEDEQYGRTCIISNINPVKFLLFNSQPKRIDIALSYNKQNAYEQMKQVAQVCESSYQSVPLTYRLGRNSTQYYNSFNGKKQMQCSMDLATIFQIQNIVGKDNVDVLY